MCSAYSPDSSEKYAMVLPSGDHAGVRSMTPGVLVKLRTSPFSAGTVRTSPCGALGAAVDLDGVLLAAGDVVDMYLPELLVDDAARSGAGRRDVLAGILDQLADLLRLRIVAEQRHRAVAVGEKVRLVADPHGIDVVGIGARHFDGAQVGKIDQPQVAGRTAAIALPGHEVGEPGCELAAVNGRVEHAFAIRRIRAHAAH